MNITWLTDKTKSVLLNMHSEQICKEYHVVCL